jgi:TctA family transporter
LIGEHGDVTVFFTRPLSGTFMVLAILLFFYPIYLSRRRKARAAAGEDQDGTAGGTPT